MIRNYRLGMAKDVQYEVEKIDRDTWELFNIMPNLRRPTLTARRMLIAVDQSIGINGTSLREKAKAIENHGQVLLRKFSAHKIVSARITQVIASTFLIASFRKKKSGI
ncbi:hypothetical protein HHI36_004235 [Cryptolaemus montrouzieri]|uniref:Uncharacterized protein n=1 Tax=Cryptolaemus montrouzieri TaxID=559131 RepID=A0ABD2NQL5_9CUCU